MNSRSLLPCSLLFALSTAIAAQTPSSPATWTSPGGEGTEWRTALDAAGGRAEVGGSGLVVGVRESEAPLRLQLDRGERGEARHEWCEGAGAAEGSRLAIDRGLLTEWYLRDARGLEQGFTLDAPLPGDRSRPVRLVFTVHGAFELTVGDDALHARFESRGGEFVVTYGGLRAWDARGRRLEARLRNAASEMAIEVDDRDATYPVTIDPWIAIETQTLSANHPQPRYHFGQGVAVDGDTALVGAPGDDDVVNDGGAGYIYTHVGTSWQPQAKLIPPSADGGDRCGGAVALDGDTAVLTSGPNTFLLQERTHVFTRTGTSWSWQAEIQPAAVSAFQSAVDVDGDTLAVGTFWVDPLGDGYGAVAVFVRAGTTWSQQALLTASTLMRFDSFGGAVALDDDTIVVGASYADVAGVSGAGAAYVFTRSGTAWSEQARLTPDDPVAGGRFGSAVAVEGNGALIGAAYADTPTLPGAGATYWFERQGSTWFEREKLFAIGPHAVDKFGASIDLDGTLACIGAPGDDEAGLDAGATYLFSHTRGGWRQSSKILAGAAKPLDHFGQSAALDGTTLLVGAPDHDPAGGGSEREGGAFLFTVRAAAHAQARESVHNFTSYVATSAPVLGGSYDGYFQTYNYLIVLAGYASPLTLTLPFGQDLLVNVADPAGELLGTPSFTGGPIVPFSLPVPSDPAFAGLEVYTQAVHTGIFGTQLTNAQDLLLGF